MSLNWDATAVEGIDSLTDAEKVTLDSLVWATMSVGINNITVANARDFLARVSFVEKVSGAYRRKIDGDKPVDLPLTAEDVLRFVGLRTNASPLTKAKFLSNQWEMHDRYSVPHAMPEKV